MTPQAKPVSWKLRGELAIAQCLRQYHRWRPRVLPPCPWPAPRLLEWGDASPRQGAIPPIIWAYWNSPQRPLLVQRCLENWHRYNPDYQIRVLDDSSLVHFVGDLPPSWPRLSVQQRSDWLRLELLRSHGGIWMDASTILTRSLDWVLQEQQRSQCDLVGFYIQRFTALPAYPVVENWFMAAPPGSAFIADLQAEFITQVLEPGSAEYLASLKRHGLYDAVVQRIESPEYLSMHVAIQRVLQDRRAHYRMALWCAEHTAFAYHEQARWDRARLKLRLFFMQQGQASVPFLVKLRGPDRRKLDHYLEQGLYLPDSIVGRHLAQEGAGS